MFFKMPWRLLLNGIFNHSLTLAWFPRQAKLLSYSLPTQCFLTNLFRQAELRVSASFVTTGREPKLIFNSSQHMQFGRGLQHLSGMVFNPEVGWKCHVRPQGGGKDGLLVLLQQTKWDKSCKWKSRFHLFIKSFSLC